MGMGLGRLVLLMSENERLRKAVAVDGLGINSRYCPLRTQHLSGE